MQARSFLTYVMRFFWITMCFCVWQEILGKELDELTKLNEISKKIAEQKVEAKRLAEEAGSGFLNAFNPFAWDVRSLSPIYLLIRSRLFTYSFVRLDHLRFLGSSLFFSLCVLGFRGNRSKLCKYFHNASKICFILNRPFNLQRWLYQYYLMSAIDPIVLCDIAIR